MNDITPTPQENEIILYQPDSSVKLEVRLENETVWLTQQQMAELFQRDRTVITRHINNIFKEKELEEKSNVHFLHFANSDKPVKLFSLDVIISVGYRVRSLRGTQFRQWANRVIKEYLLRGYSINQRLTHMENRIEHRLSEHDSQIKELHNQLELFVRTSLPPKEAVIFDGQIFDAYNIMSDLIRGAHKRIVLVDNYVDDSVLCQLDKRCSDVSATVYTHPIKKTLRLDLERHNAQYPPIELKDFSRAHDRFLVVDDTIYHVGSSFKDIGKKLTAYSRMEIVTADEFISYLDSQSIRIS